MKKFSRSKMIFLVFAAMVFFGLIAACGSTPTSEACLVNGDPECNNLPPGLNADGGTNPDTGTGTGGDSGTAGKDSGGNAGDGGTGKCSDNPNFGKICVTLDGKMGHFHCLDDKITCLPDGGGGTGGDAGGGGSGGDGGGSVYHCATDPKKGTICEVNTGVCYSKGLFLCYADDKAPECSVKAKPANPLGEICGNGLDDDCDGNTDETPCTTGGTGGSGGGTGGSGGSDAGGSGGTDGGGSGGSGGGATCTTASAITATILAPSALTSLFMGASTVDSSNPLIKGLVNGNMLALNASGGLSVSINTGKLNIFRANSPGGNPTTILDDLFCRQLGINPPTPSSCNMSVIGTRKSAAYLAAVNVVFQCWRSGGSSCVSTISGHVPGDVFSLMKVVQNGASLSESPFADAYSGAPHFIIVEHPPLCP